MHVRHDFEFRGEHISFDFNWNIPKQRNDIGNINSMALDIAGGCNLECVYCSERTILPQRRPMSLKIIYKALNCFIKWAKKNSNVFIHLANGEPLLYADNVRKLGIKARELTKKSNQKLNLFLTTNGTLLNEKICNWIICEGWNIRISIDGPASIHNKYRGEGTYELIEKYLCYLAKKIPNRLWTTSVLCHGANFSKIFKHLANLKVKNIDFSPVISKPHSKLTLNNTDLINYRNFLQNYVYQIYKSKSQPVFNQFKNRILKVIGFGNTPFSCSAGRKLVAVDSNGDLFPCFRFLGLKKYKIGALNNGFDPESVHNFQLNVAKPVIKIPKCRKCWAAPFCGGPCYAQMELFNINANIPPSDYCGLIKSECEAAIWFVEKLRQKDPEKLIKYLNGNINSLFD